MRQFKIGDKVTFKDPRETIGRGGEVGTYWFGGPNQARITGEVTARTYTVDHPIYGEVTAFTVSFIRSGRSRTYHMLECEFEEYVPPTELTYNLEESYEKWK